MPPAKNSTGAGTGEASSAGCIVAFFDTLVVTAASVNVAVGQSVAADTLNASASPATNATCLQRIATAVAPFGSIE